MKIVITCDLHFGPTGKKTVTKMLQEIQNEQPDVVVLAGDIGEGEKNIDRCLGLFDPLACPVLVLAGNHDLWVDEGESSLEMWNETLPELVTLQHKYLWLEEKNHYIRNIAIVGSYLHYDYSAADKVGVSAGLTDAYWQENKRHVNNDGWYMRGLPSDKEFAATIGKAFVTRLEEAQQREKITQIIVVTHVPCLERQITRRPHNHSWSLGTPYFGNITYESKILGCSKVTHVISGHSHQDERHDINGVQAIVIPSDYGAPKYEVIETGLEELI